MSALLDVRGLHKGFGGVKAVAGCSFCVRERSITALIGPNGAGKTTVFNLITGLIPVERGEIAFGGQQLHALRSHEIFDLGIARTFQMLRIFPKLTALENLMIAQRGRAEGIFDALLRPSLVREEERARRERAHECLRMVGLEEKAHAKAGGLSYGQQKLLDIARCVASGARLILLDEPVAGVNPTVRERIKALLRSLRERGTTILVIEHDMGFVMDLCDEIVVLDHGEEIASGPPERVRNDRRVIAAYLGE